MIFSPSLEAVFRGSSLSLEQRIETVARCGYRAFEIWGWSEQTIQTIVQTKERLGLTLASMCTRMASLVDPAQRDTYIAGLRESIDAAGKLGCRFLISQTGNKLPGVPRERQRQTMIDGLKRCAPYLEEAGVTLIVEPLNTKVNHPGHYLVHAAEAFEVVAAVDSPQVKVVYDIYHQQISEGDLIPTIRAGIGHIAYFHAADHPGRNEPGTGEIHYPNVLEAIRHTGYSGYIGLEYIPLGDPEASLLALKRELCARFE